MKDSVNTLTLDLFGETALPTQTVAPVKIAPTPAASTDKPIYLILASRRPQAYLGPFGTQKEADHADAVIQKTTGENTHFSCDPPADFPAPPIPSHNLMELILWEKARMRFALMLRATGRDGDIITNKESGRPNLDHRKLSRLANEILGRPASDRPSPTTDEWEQVAAGIARAHGLVWNETAAKWEAIP